MRWRTPPRDIAALVTEASRDRFEALLYHFGAEPRDIQADLYLLKPGRYAMALIPEHEAPLMDTTVDVEGTVKSLSFTVPPRIPCRLRLVPAT